MMNKPPPFKGLNARIHSKVQIKGRESFKSGVWVRAANTLDIPELRVSDLGLEEFPIRTGLPKFHCDFHISLASQGMCHAVFGLGFSVLRLG